jgi:hypothetical protein
MGNGPILLTYIECTICARRLPGLLVNILTGHCTDCHLKAQPARFPR